MALLPEEMPSTTLATTLATTEPWCAPLAESLATSAPDFEAQKRFFQSLRGEKSSPRAVSVKDFFRHGHGRRAPGVKMSQVEVSWRGLGAVEVQRDTRPIWCPEISRKR